MTPLPLQRTAAPLVTRRADSSLFVQGRSAAIPAALLVLLVAAWAFARRENGGQDDERARAETEEEHGEAVDSVVTLDSAARRFAGIEIANAGLAPSTELVATGTITYNPDYASIVAPRVEGRVVVVRADLGDRVERGSVLAVLQSSEVGETRGALERARAALDVARQNYEREKRLYEQSVSSQKEMLDAEGEYRSAQAEFNSASARLRAVGASAGAQGAEYSLVSPVAGTVVERHVMPGQIAGPETNLFTVADLRRLWITVEVYASDASRVRQGALVQVSPRAFPGETFPGRVSFAGGVVDAATRTIKVRVTVDNPSSRLRPGMFAQVRVAAPSVVGAGGGEGVVIPELAVQDLNGRMVVFVPGGSPGEFVARTVILGERTGRGVRVLSGLRPEEAFVVSGAFQLKSELLKATFGEEDEA